MPKSHKYKSTDGKRVQGVVDQFHKEFCCHLDVQWDLPNDLTHIGTSFLRSVGADGICARSERKKVLITIINTKFRLNRKRVKVVIDAAARKKLYFNPYEKSCLVYLFNSNDKAGLQNWAKSLKVPQECLIKSEPVTESESLRHLHQELIEATINRSDARSGVQEERKQSIFRSLFGSWLFLIADQRRAFAFNSGFSVDKIEDDYFRHLQKYYPQFLTRSCGAISVAITCHQIESFSLAALRTWLFKEVEDAFSKLSNYSYLFLLFDFPKNRNCDGKAWELLHDVTLYAERCQLNNLKAGFFHPKKIQNTTTSHIKTIDPTSSKFNVYQHGFSFRDCVVICSDQLDRQTQESQTSYAILLLEKCVADETPIPCPACRSLDVRGNSYPVFGVKSWECLNAICPERSAFDRGNRFSGVSILRAAAAKDQRAEIPEESLVQWKLDVVGPKSKLDIFDMLVRHYSLPGDSLTFVNWNKLPAVYLNRKIVMRGCSGVYDDGFDPLVSFEKTPFFNRYLNAKSLVPKQGWKKIANTPAWLDLYHGSCLEVLNSMQEAAIDGAVTSPPYYNAREYSSWSNLYCYLYDMKIAAEGVYRVLKPGGYYLFNIFDNFDNDNILAFSALGKRRLTLGAYMNQIFRKCGFQTIGNIVWHKGEIEGKRNYNQGNNNPYYQLPLNTWEHILVLKKPGGVIPEIKFPSTIYFKPVIKWFNGENRHGHSAPFPEELPALLCSNLGAGAKVLDPFAGSLTTATTCKNYKQTCIAIEIHEDYCNLGLKKIAQAIQLPLLN